MKQVGGLVRHRIGKEWKFQFGVWRTAVDWTVALYIVIPVLIYAVKSHIDWWMTSPDWASQLPLGVLAIIPLALVANGQVRVFAEEADQLFLIQQGDWIRKLRTLSLLYSLAMESALFLLLFLYLAPVFLHAYGLSWTQLLLWYILCVLLKTILGLYKQRIALRFSGWREWIVRWAVVWAGSLVYYVAVLFSLSGPLPANSPLTAGGLLPAGGSPSIGGLLWRAPSMSSLLPLVTAVLALWLVLLIPRHIRRQGTFLKDIEREQTVRLKFAAPLLKMARVYTRKSTVLAIKKRPWIFSHSNHLFKTRDSSHLMAEACFKSVLRSRSYLTLYGEMTGISVAIGLAIPQGWKLLAWVAFAFLIAKFMEVFWQNSKQAPFIRLFTWEEAVFAKAAGKAIFLLILPSFLLLSLALGIQLYAWPGALAFTAAGLIIAYMTARGVGEMNGFKK